jgi:uncharacterized protein (UPF0147 family)
MVIQGDSERAVTDADTVRIIFGVSNQSLPSHGRMVIYNGSKEINMVKVLNSFIELFDDQEQLLR